MKKFTIKMGATVLVEVQAKNFNQAMKLVNEKCENSRNIYIRPIGEGMDCNEDMSLEKAREKYLLAIKN